MKEQPNNANEAFEEIVRDKIEDQDKRITGLESMLSQFNNYSPEISQIKRGIEEINTRVKNISFPEKQMQELSNNLDAGIKLLRQPVQNKVLHHHHIPKVIFIACGLFIVICLICTGWYMTSKSLDQYKAGDTKYRYLKLYDNKSLRQLLNITDSLFLINSGMRDSVIQQEEQFRKKLEMLEQAAEMEQKAKELKEKVKDK